MRSTLSVLHIHVAGLYHRYRDMLISKTETSGSLGTPRSFALDAGSYTEATLIVEAVENTNSVVAG